MRHSLNEADQRVLDCVARTGAGASAIDIARAALGHRRRRHSINALNMIGLQIAARLCGEGVIAPTRSNNFVLAADRR
jgi:ABC-type transporter Mla maintaining outer membrane lipid asymmetry permease subunit MlaE